MVKLNQNVACREEHGILIDAAWVPVGLTEQFLGDADTYHDRYFNNDYWTYLVDRGLTAGRVDRNEALKVLDIGSGSGNTVFPSVKMMPKAEFITSDISLPLLKILSRISREAGVNNLSLYCFDLSRDLFAENSFDVVIGGAILHHIQNPHDALRNTAKWAKPGAPIILFEPMEVGAHIMSAIYQTLHDELKDEADPRLLTLFRQMIEDYEHRFGVSRVKPWTASLDDKWMFTRSYFDDLATELNLHVDSISPLGEDLRDHFTNMVNSIIRVSGNGHLPTPPRMSSILREFDDGIAEPLKCRLMSESLIVLRKFIEEPSDPSPA